MANEQPKYLYQITVNFTSRILFSPDLEHVGERLILETMVFNEPLQKGDRVRIENGGEDIYVGNVRSRSLGGHSFAEKADPNSVGRIETEVYLPKYPRAYDQIKNARWSTKTK